MSIYTVGQLARTAGVPTSTIRFYERRGLLKPDFRTHANYRSYGTTSLERLRFIRSAQSIGFSLTDVTELLRLTSSDKSPCDDVVSLLEKRLAEIRRRINEFRHVEKVLARSLSDCCKGSRPDLCDEISRLRHTEAEPLPPPVKKSRART